MSGALEGVVKLAINAWLTSQGYLDVTETGVPETLPPRCPGVFWRNNTGLFRGAGGRPVRAGCKGSCDRFIARFNPPAFFAVEDKRERGGRVSKEQARWGAAMQRAGVRWVVVTGVDDVRAALQH